MKKVLKKKLYLLITGVLAFLIIGIVYYLKNVSPLGNNSLLDVDFFHQYGPMLGELFDRIKNGLNLTYSFRMGIGLPFFLNFFNYLSSPFNIIMFLFKRKDLLTSYSVIIGLKAVASSITMLLLLKYKFNKKYLFIPLSLLYAFNAYFVAYYWNIMWLDGLVMLPLITYGIEKLVKENKCLLYCLSLAIMLFANYFIGYMICIFSVIYFIFYLVYTSNSFDWKYILKKTRSFFCYSLLAGGLCAFFLIPLYFSLKGVSATHDVFPTSQYYSFTLKEFLFNHFSGVGSTVLKSGLTNAPNISCGVLSLALLIIMFVNPKISIKRKICYLSLLAFFIISFFGWRLDFMWQAFHVPNDLPYRYSFIYSFVLILIAAHSIKDIKEIDSWHIVIIYLCLMIMISFIKKMDIVNINKEMINMNYIITTIYFISYLLYKYLSKFNWISIVIVTATVMVECVLEINNNWIIDQEIHYFYDEYNEIQDNIQNIDDNEMYRIEKKELLTFSDPSWYGYYGITGFSSMEYEALAVLQNNLGIPGNRINSFYYKKNTPIYNMMFNLKYFMNNCWWEKLDNILVDKNDYNLGLMYGVSKDIKDWELNNNPFENQNSYILKATGIENVLEEVKNIKKELFYKDDINGITKYILSKAGKYYLYPKSSNLGYIVIKNEMYLINEKNAYFDMLVDEKTTYKDYNENYIIEIDVNDNPLEIYVEHELLIDDSLIYVYQINNKKMEKVYNTLLPSKVNITEFNENDIRGVVSLNKDSNIYTSIPYDDGWKVLIDGKRVETFKIGNALLGFDIESGEHHIELIYQIPYKKISVFISVLSFVILTFVQFYKSKKKNV